MQVRYRVWNSIFCNQNLGLVFIHMYLIWYKFKSNAASSVDDIYEHIESVYFVYDKSFCQIFVQKYKIRALITN